MSKIFNLISLEPNQISTAFRELPPINIFCKISI